MTHASIRVLLAAAVAMALLAGCKPTEQNYKASYDKAMAARQAADSLASDVEPMPGAEQAVIGGLQIGVVRERVAITPDGGGINEYIKRYCVVAARFRQRFNALSMRERLVENGYPGAFVVNTALPEYLVVAGSTSDASEAAALAERLRADRDCTPQKGCPLLLIPSQIKK